MEYLEALSEDKQLNLEEVKSKLVSAGCPRTTQHEVDVEVVVACEAESESCDYDLLDLTQPSETSQVE